MGDAGRPIGGRAGTEMPVLLITGAGMAAVARLRTLPVLAKRFPVLTLDAGIASDNPRHAVAGSPRRRSPDWMRSARRARTCTDSPSAA